MAPTVAATGAPAGVGDARHGRGRVHGWLHERALRTRVAYIAAGVVGLSVLVVTVASYLAVRIVLVSRVDSELTSRARSVAYAVASNTVSPNVFAAVPPAALGAADIRLAAVYPDGLAKFNQRQPPLGDPEMAVATGTAQVSTRTAVIDGIPFRVVAVPAEEPNGRPLALVLAKPLTEVDRVLEVLTLTMLLVGGVGVALAGFAGLAVAQAGLRPVWRLTEAAERVARTQQLDPIPVSGGDELASLATSFNAMLAALEESRQQQRRLVADASHELRTPLTSLRTNIDLLIMVDGPAGPDLPAAERADLLRDVRAQIDELTSLIADLTELARDEAPHDPVEPVDLAAVTARALDRARLRGPGQTFDVDLQPWTVLGQERQLTRAVTNLLDNAVKWNPPDGTVQVRLHDGTLTVGDEGPGIAEDDLPHVFDRFYRSDDARAMPGSGLGLAIVRQAAVGHGGTVSAARRPGGGTVMALRLPGSPLPPPGWTGESADPAGPAPSAHSQQRVTGWGA